MNYNTYLYIIWYKYDRNDQDDDGTMELVFLNWKRRSPNNKAVEEMYFNRKYFVL